MFLSMFFRNMTIRGEVFGADHLRITSLTAKFRLEEPCSPVNPVQQSGSGWFY